MDHLPMTGMDEPDDAAVTPVPAATDALYPEILRIAKELALLMLSEDDAEDVAQDVAIDAWRRTSRAPGGLDVTRGLRPFVYAAVQHKIVDRERSRTKRPIPFTDYEDLYGVAAFDQLSQALHEPPSELGGAIAAALDSVSKTPRLVWYALCFRGLSHKAVARERGISVKTVGVHLNTAQRAVSRAIIRHLEEGR